jgi:hypothetical protein
MSGGGACVGEIVQTILEEGCAIFELVAKEAAMQNVKN